jgi:hypothetical protein
MGLKVLSLGQIGYPKPQKSGKYRRKPRFPHRRDDGQNTTNTSSLHWKLGKEAESLQRRDLPTSSGFELSNLGTPQISATNAELNPSVTELKST